MGSSRSIDIDTDFSPAALARILLERLTLSPTTRFQLAYSGGLDSHVLLHALAHLQRTHGLNLGAVHVDHGLQADSRDWAQHCARVCAALGIPCIIERVQVPDARADGLEAAARRARYVCLARHVGAGDALLTAHHLDDQAETVLLQLLRGAGVHGLAAMPAIAPFSAGVLARPLLGFTRAALAHYARAEKLQWIEDSSNRDLRRARNLVRHQVLPLLQQRWPAAVRQLAQTARHAAEAAALLDDLAGADLGACATGAALRVTLLARLPLARQRNVLRHWIRQRGLRVPSAALLERILDQVRAAPRTRHAVIHWRDADLRRYRDELVLMPAGEGLPAPAQAIVWDGKSPLALPDIGLRLRLWPEFGSGLSRARLEGAVLQVRFRHGGETCRLPGRGHRHKLKKLLQAAGVPPWERARLPLLFVNDTLAAVGDRWVCEPFAARADEPGLALVVEKIAAAGKRET